MLLTPMVDSRGPLWIYQRLLQVFSKMDLPAGITPLDIIVGSPWEVSYRQLFRWARLSKEASSIAGTAGSRPASVIGDKTFGAIVLYRMDAWNDDAGDAERFDSQVKALLAA